MLRVKERREMQITYKFRLYPTKEQEEKPELKELNSKILQLDKLYVSKVGNIPIRIPREIEGTIRQVIVKKYKSGALVTKVNPRGTSKEYKYGTELDRNYNASLNILERGMEGQGLPFAPLETEPLRELVQVSASSVVEGGSHFLYL
jgi:hypothetical protein